MREKRPSQTASLVTFLRALADSGHTTAQGFHDPVARNLLSFPWSQLLTRTERRAPHLSPRARTRLTARVDFMALRTLAIDAQVKDAVARGVRQLVILGAGLDARPYRMDELGAVRIFEVDHPATQAYKQRRVIGLTSQGRSLTFVPVNFERDSLDAQLEAHGHRKGEPTLWIWEGVVSYLTEAAFRGTLHTLAERSAPGSRVVINYSVPGSQRLAFTLLLHLWGEPHIGRRTPEQMAAAVAAAGFQVSEDTGYDQWAQRFGARPPLSERATRMRIVVGTR